MLNYFLLKVIHLGALIFWLGPALGAWLVLKYANHKSHNSQTIAVIYPVFFMMLSLEHIAFAALLTSGIAMAHSTDMWQTPWLHTKLSLLLLIIIPMEIIDIIIGNWLVKKFTEQKLRDLTLTNTQERLVEFYHGTFTYLAIAILPITVLAIMWLAVSKTTF